MSSSQYDALSAPSDTTAPFLTIPWTASLLSQPDLVFRVPGSRKTKQLPDTEDSLFADILKTGRTVQSCISFYRNPGTPEEKIQEMSTLCYVGDGMNGHPGILHGGIVATLIDEAMGMLQSANIERDFLYAKSRARPNEKLPQSSPATFTVELKVTYLKPVITPGAVLVKTRSLKKEARKEWLATEVLQEVDGKVIVCSKGEALFVEPKLRAKM